MSLIVIGVNHKTAQLALRERVAFAPEQMADALQHASNFLRIDEIVILSTCNRTEIFAYSSQEDGNLSDRARSWLCEYHNLSLEELGEHYYVHNDNAVLQHMIAVGSGLDSMVIGEPQIFGQFKSAYAVSLEQGFIGSEFSQLFPHAFSVCKRVRTDTAIGENPVSVAYAAVSLAQRIFSDLSSSHALLIGAGETIELVARYLVERGVTSLVVANRTLTRAKELAETFSAEAVLLSEIPEQLISADIVISSTASQLPLLGKGAVEHAIKKRKHKPILMVDIAVPRDIEPQVGDLRDVYLYSVDDLREIVEGNKKARQREVSKADRLIEEGVAAYLHIAREQDAVTTIKAFRGKAERLRDEELAKALRQLNNGQNPEEVLSALARNVTNKLLHEPSVRLKKASALGEKEVIAVAQQLFALKDLRNDKE